MESDLPEWVGEILPRQEHWPCHGKAFQKEASREGSKLGCKRFDLAVACSWSIIEWLVVDRPIKASMTSVDLLSTTPRALPFSFCSDF
jgi:hypothetical protein